MNPKSLGTIITMSILTLIIVSFVAMSISFISMKSAQATSEEFANVNTPIMEQALAITEGVGMMGVFSRAYMYDAQETSYKNILHYADKIITATDALDSYSKHVTELPGYTDQIKRYVGNYKTSVESSHATVIEIENLLVDLKTTSAEFISTVEKVSDLIRASQLEAINILRGSNLLSYISRNDEVVAALEKTALINSQTVAMVIEAATMRDSDLFKQFDNMAIDFNSQLARASKNSKTPDSVPVLMSLKVLSDRNEAQILKIKSLVGELSQQNSYRAGVAENIRNSMTSLNAYIGKVSSEDSGKLVSFLSFVKFIIILSAVALAVSGVVIMLILRNRVTQKLQEFVSIVANFTDGDGDLTKRIPVTSANEIGQLAVYINKFIENIHNIINEVKIASDDVASGNNQLAVTMEELSTTFGNQSMQVATVANNMESMKVTSQDVVSGLNQNMDKMSQTDNIVTMGSEQLKDVMKTVADIKKQTEKLGKTVQNLTDSSGKIGEILSVINDIADQTNLLALNAAIEAARAGEAGRGFAVVADEVRKLAERTQSSTSEIAEIITTLQQESSNASGEMENATKTVNSGIESIQKADGIFVTVVDSVHEITETTSKANNAVNEQFTMIEEINDNTQGLASGIEESVHAVNEINVTVSHLQQRAEKLKNIVEQFKV